MPSVKKKYKFPPGIYASQYNISTSSVVRYQKEGAPFDNPEKFAKWMAGRSHKPKSMRTPGENFRDLRVEVGRSSKKKPDAAHAASQQEEPPPVRGKRAFIEGGGLRVEIARQEAECAEAYRLYRQEVDMQNSIEAMAFHKIWVAAQEQLRKLCKDVPKSEKDDEKVLPVGDVEFAWRNALNEMKSMLENIPATVSIGLTGVSPEVRLAVEKSISDEVSNVLTALRPAPWIK